MKKVFLLVVLLLTVSFAFAANDVEKASTIDVEEVLEKNNSLEISIVNSVIETSISFKDGTGRCYYTLTTTTTYPDGSTTSTSQKYVTEASSAEDCTNRANAHAAHLNSL